MPLKAAMTLTARVIAVREIDPGESVGYNAKWTCRRPSRIGTIGIGYGDGYPRHVASGTPVGIRNVSVPLIGRISMDSLTVDLTDHSEVCAGDEATLWGPRLPVTTIADFANTIPYQLFTSIQRRVPREYYTS